VSCQRPGRRGPRLLRRARNGRVGDSMAVIVQRLVKASVAGVLFTSTR
jgi:hypothetical protein